MTFTETTGAYDASTNVGGWDSPNIDYDDVTDAYITITDSAGSITTYNVFTQLDALSTPWASNTVFTDLTISLPDGLGTVVYTVVTSSTTYTSKTYQFYTYCAIRCCVHEYIHTAISLYGSDPCKYADKIAYSLYLKALLDDFVYAAQGCNYNDAAAMFTKLQTVCNVNNTNCGC